MSFSMRQLVFVGVVLGLSSAATGDDAEWRLAKDLPPDVLARADLSGPGPRHAEIEYIPEEAYPFQAPFNAEEMGYRLMNFNHVASWSHALADVFGSITKEGYLTEGITVGMVDDVGEGGAAGRIYSKPGDTYQRWNYFYTYPPRDEGVQQVWHLKRTGPEQPTKLDFFVYSPSLRRVRRQPPPRRDSQFPDSVQSFDDIVGLEAWEFEWRLVGTDVLDRTVRFPKTRPTITLSRADGSFFEKNTAEIQMMGDDYPHYRADGGVDTFVVEAVPRGDWLPTYQIARILYWVDQHFFFPLRIEQYDADGALRTIQVRVGERQNLDLPDGFGYTNPHSVYWDVRLDLVTYSCHDAMLLQTWTDAERETLFNPDFMRRRWLRNGARSQSLVVDPEKFHLRPDLLEGRFPDDRPLSLSPEVRARVEAQDAAGRLVFAGGAEDDES